MKERGRMAEFCLECMNKYLMGKNNQLTEKDVTAEIDLCGGCGQWKPCVVTIVNKEKIFRKKLKQEKENKKIAKRW